MKKIFVLVLFVFIGITKNYGQGWQWKNPLPDSKILKDLNDNLYVFSNNAPNFTITKLNTNGGTLWTKTSAGNAEITAYKIDMNNNLIVIGNITSTSTIAGFTLIPKGQKSFFILKFSPASALLTANVYGSSSITFAKDLFITSNGDYLIGGGFKGTFSISGDSIIGDTLQNFFIVKTDNNQNLLWSERNTFSTSGGEAWIDEVVETSTGKICAAFTFYGLIVYKGIQFTNDGQFLMRLDNARNLDWVKYLDYPGLSYTLPTDIQTNGDTVYMNESIQAPHFSCSNICMWNDSGIKTTKYIDSYSFGYQVANGKIYYAFIAMNGDPNYPNSNIFFYRKIGSLSLQLSESGQTADSAVTVNGSYSNLQYINAGSLYIGGQGEGMTTHFAGKYTMSTINSVVEVNEADQFKIFPNPTKGQFTLQLNDGMQKKIQYNDMIYIFNQSGNCILRQQFFNSTSQQIDISRMAKGIYFIEVESGGARVNKKIVLD